MNQNPLEANDDKHSFGSFTFGDKTKHSTIMEIKLLIKHYCRHCISL